MVHVHKKSGLEFEIGRIDDPSSGTTYDITTILKFPDYDNDENDLNVELVDWYFGEYNEEHTNDCIDRYLSTRNN